MNFLLLLTDRCNLNCTYCRGRISDGGGDWGLDLDEIDGTLPSDLDYDLAHLYRFLSRDPEASVMFYGGEPLLRPDLVSKIVHEAPAGKFSIQTNGILLDLLPIDTIARFEYISVSLDGDEEQTDRHRGRGTFRRVMENLRWLREHGYRGEIIARMTVTMGDDIERAVRYLSENTLHPFDSIHWQLDAGFSCENSIDAFCDWVEHSYKPGIARLARRWIEKCEAERKVPRWYPYVATMKDTLELRRSPLRCGCGHASYSILTNGYIVPCPIMVGLRRWYLGHVSTSDPLTLPKLEVRGACAECRIRDFCGGRCLYAHEMKLWPEELRAVVCSTVDQLRGCIIEIAPAMERLIREGIVSHSDLEFPRYNGCEIIP